MRVLSWAGCGLSDKRERSDQARIPKADLNWRREAGITWSAPEERVATGEEQKRKSEKDVQRALFATTSNTKVWSVFRSWIMILILICMRKRLVGMLWLRIGIVRFD